MSFYNGDRVCKLTRSGSTAEFGRVTENVDGDEVVNPTEADLLRTYGDVVQERIGLRSGSKRSSSSSEERVLGLPSPVCMRTGKNGKNVNRSITWDDNRSEKTVILSARDEQFYKVVDRLFSVGDRVVMKGRLGKVLEVIPLATVKVRDTDPDNTKGNTVIPDLKLSQIRPITHIFPGVMFELRGWVGHVIDVERKITFKLDDGTCVSINESDKSYHKRPKLQKNRIISQYPFAPEIRYIPFPGIYQKFSLGELEVLREEEKESVAGRRLTRSQAQANSLQQQSPPVSQNSTNTTVNTNDFISGIVESVHIVSVQVRWTGRLPGYLIKPEDEKEVLDSIPGCFIRSPEDISKLRPTYINTSTYFDKKGLCVLHHEIKTNEQILIPEKKWSQALFSVSSSGFSSDIFNLQMITLADKENQQEQQEQQQMIKKKRQEKTHRNKIVDGRTRAIIVYKHFVRHMYKVSFDNDLRFSYYHYGTELEPVAIDSRKIGGSAHPHLFVVPKDDSDMYGKCDYGVVVDTTNKNKLVVDWLKIENNVGHLVSRSFKVSSDEISSHPTFSSLRVGRAVVRHKDYMPSDAGNFCFGTIIAVDRFALGQVRVYCAIERDMIELWPHMIDLFSGMSTKEQLECQLIGTRLQDQSP